MNFEAWLGTIDSSLQVDEGDRAALALSRINDNPAMKQSIQITRDGGATFEAAQTVRVEFLRTPREISITDNNNTARTIRIDCVVFGIRNHATLADTDILKDDEFGIDGVRYRVLDVLLFAGEKQARCYRTS